MRRVLVLFLDGVGLGEDDADKNPFVSARMPVLQSILAGRRLVRPAAPFHGEQASLLALDANLGVTGNPQSATGQAALLTGRNIPQEIGRHYGPKPNPAITEMLAEDNLFMAVLRQGGSAGLLNAYPPRYFEAIRSRKRLYSAIPQAVTSAGIALMTAEDLQAGLALSADFTGEGWSDQPDFPPAPVYAANEAGHQLARLAGRYQLAWFDYWPSDLVGHRGTMSQAIALLETFDAVLGGLAEAWQEESGVFVLISDHGNLEDMLARGHTTNPVPALVFGLEDVRRAFTQDLRDLTDFYAAVVNTIFG